MSCEEYYKEIVEYVFLDSIGELPPATYLGNDEWLGTDGIHYIIC